MENIETDSVKERKPWGSRCSKAQRKANQRTWQKSNREKVRKKSLARYQANREQINAQKRTRYKINPDIGDRQRAKYVGLTLEQLRALEERQGHACAICGRRKKKKLNIDHDHETGVVRGLLCHPCNTAIGLLGDGSELLKRTVAYIEKSELKSSIQ